MSGHALVCQHDQVVREHASAVDHGQTTPSLGRRKQQRARAGTTARSANAAPRGLRLHGYRGAGIHGSALRSLRNDPRHRVCTTRRGQRGVALATSTASQHAAASHPGTRSRCRDSGTGAMRGAARAPGGDRRPDAQRLLGARGRSPVAEVAGCPRQAARTALLNPLRPAATVPQARPLASSLR